MTTNNNYTEQINATAEAYKNSSKLRKEFNNVYYSLSKLLRDAQQKSFMPLASPIFAALGLRTDGKLRPSDVVASLAPEQFSTNKKGEKIIIIWSRTQATDAEGNKVFEKDGVTPVMVEKSTTLARIYENERKQTIIEGSWTMNKFAKLIAQRNAFKAAK